MAFARRYWKEESGASAAEFALVVIPFFAMVLGIIATSLMLYANETLHSAVEAAARCASVSGTTTCNSPGATQTFATNHYSGPNISPTFTASVASCGNKVHADASIPLNAIVFDISVPLSATACFPLQAVTP